MFSLFTLPTITKIDLSERTSRILECAEVRPLPAPVKSDSSRLAGGACTESQSAGGPAAQHKYRGLGQLETVQASRPWVPVPAPAAISSPPTMSSSLAVATPVSR